MSGLKTLKLSILEHTYAVCRLSPDSQLPEWIDKNDFWSVTKTNDELSIVCRQKNIPADTKAERGWSIIKVEGPLDFGLTGILASIANPLAKAKISIFAVSTFDTDYILVKDDQIDLAKSVHLDAWFSFNP